MNRTEKTPNDSKPTTPQRMLLIPTYVDEDPELTPERWWARRQGQSLSGL